MEDRDPSFASDRTYLPRRISSPCNVTSRVDWTDRACTVFPLVALHIFRDSADVCQLPESLHINALEINGTVHMLLQAGCYHPAVSN